MPSYKSGCSSEVEHNLAKVGVVGSNPIARSIIQIELGLMEVWPELVSAWVDTDCRLGTPSPREL